LITKDLSLREARAYAATYLRIPASKEKVWVALNDPAGPPREEILIAEL
jgi:hypothetical protein